MSHLSKKTRDRDFEPFWNWAISISHAYDFTWDMSPSMTFWAISAYPRMILWECYDQRYFATLSRKIFSGLVIVTRLGCFRLRLEDHQLLAWCSFKLYLRRWLERSANHCCRLGIGFFHYWFKNHHFYVIHRFWCSKVIIYTKTKMRGEKKCNISPIQ